jgi:hypothetical protein
MAKGPKHLPWFDDAPKTARSRRGPGAAETRGARPKVRALAGALPKPLRPRLKPPKPVKSPGMKAGTPRTDRSRTRVPRRLAIPSLASLPRRTLVSWFANR